MKLIELLDKYPNIDKVIADIDNNPIDHITEDMHNVEVLLHLFIYDYIHIRLNMEVNL